MEIGADAMENDPRALARVREWYGPHSSTAAEWPADTLLMAKGDTTVSVVLPARDEESTVFEPTVRGKVSVKRKAKRPAASPRRTRKKKAE